MCTFHQQRQAGILLERQGGKRASYVLFTHHSRQIGIHFEMEGAEEHHVCFSSFTTKWYLLN